MKQSICTIFPVTFALYKLCLMVIFDLQYTTNSVLGSTFICSSLSGKYFVLIREYRPPRAYIRIIWSFASLFYCITRPSFYFVSERVFTPTKTEIHAELKF